MHVGQITFVDNVRMHDPFYYNYLLKEKINMEHLGEDNRESQVYNQKNLLDDEVQRTENLISCLSDRLTSVLVAEKPQVDDGAKTLAKPSCLVPLATDLSDIKTHVSRLNDWLVNLTDRLEI